MARAASEDGSVDGDGERSSWFFYLLRYFCKLGWYRINGSFFPLGLAFIVFFVIEGVHENKEYSFFLFLRNVYDKTKFKNIEGNFVLIVTYN